MVHKMVIQDGAQARDFHLLVNSSPNFFKNLLTY